MLNEVDSQPRGAHAREEIIKGRIVSGGEKKTKNPHEALIRNCEFLGIGEMSKLNRMGS